ncbi:MAG: hypothetical protein FWG91_03680 [Lachnospiraceae bacterium]|nr:hypothetical protein [Lachnospiraceae bacterium]
MNKEQLKKIAADIEAKHGADARERIFGNLDKLTDDDDSVCNFFHRFIEGMDELNDSGFLMAVMAKNCPCSHSDFEIIIKEIYDESKTLFEFAQRLERGNLIEDVVSLEGNILFLTKHPFEKYGQHNHRGLFIKGCHCGLASRAKKEISNIFCHCCTVGFYGKMFGNALGTDVKVEFIESIISGGASCKAAIHLPPKNNNEAGDIHE